MSSENGAEIRVMLADTDSERMRGLAYLTDRYTTTLGITPTLPEYLFVAYRHTEILGTLGITTEESLEGLRLLSLYSIGHDAHLISSPSKSVEFVRWASESAEASILLIRDAIACSMQLGKEYAWCEHTANVHRAAQRYGIIFHLISERIISSMVEEQYIPYYASNQTKLYVFELNQGYEAVTAYSNTHMVTNSE